MIFGSFPGDRFSHYKAREIIFTAPRMVLNEITYIMPWQVIGSLPILFPESDLIISTCSSLRPQGQQCNNTEILTRAGAIKAAGDPQAGI